MINKKRFLFSESCNYEKYDFILKKSASKEISKLHFSAIKADYNLGDFSFFIRKSRNEEIEIPFYYNGSKINFFWEFLEVLCLLDDELIFPIFTRKCDKILYVNSKNKTGMRFAILEDLSVVYDVLINKRKFISGFYKELLKIFLEYESIAYFEKPLIDFDFWIKDSEIIKNYLENF